MTIKNNMQNDLKLQQTVRFFETLLRASVDGIVITDPANNIIFVNDTFCKIFSSNRHDVIETNLFIWLAKLGHNAKDIWKGLESKTNELGIAKDVEFVSKTGDEMRYFSVNSSLLEKIDIEETGLIISIWRDDTERKLAKEALQQAHDKLELQVEERTMQLSNTNIALRESKQFIESIVNLSPDILYVFDIIERKNVYSNDGVQKILNYSVKEVQEMGDKLLSILMHPDDFKIYLEETYPQYSKLKDNQPIIHEYRMKNKNGRWHWLYCKEIIYSRQQDGAPKQIFGVVHDITERKRAEEALRESESRLKLAHKAAGLGNWEWDLITNELYWAEENYEIHGIDPHKVKPSYDAFIQVVDPEEHEFVNKAVADALAGKRKFDIDYTVNRQDNGEKCIINSKADVIRDSAGKAVKMFGTVQDITERKRTENALRCSETELQESQRVAQVGSWQWIIASDTITWSPGYYRIIGRDLALPPPNYKEHLKMYTQESAGRLEAAVSEAMKGAPYELDLEMLHPDGLQRFMIARCEAVRDAAGQVVMLRGTLQDITQRKRTEEELKKYRDHLEELVKERTAELEIARDRALGSDRLKSAFLATMSHELRTPLNSIIGYTGLILMGYTGSINDEQKKQLDMVNTSANHLLSLIVDILDISKIESGELKIYNTPFMMKTAIGNAIQIVGPLAQTKGLALHVEVSQHVRDITSDQKRIEQILINLLGNAIKFTEKGEVKIECKVSDGMVITRVIDTGIGIKPENMDRLFKPFLQLDNGLTRRYEGTGLGLSICKKLVEMLGGKIWAESEIGKGSVFTFTLPVKGETI
ncbi:MAG: PAS domain S-box protein [Candidatus Methanoperedens sp.]